LSVSVITGTALVLLVAAVFIDVMIGLQLQEAFDDALLEKARALESLTELEPGGIEFESVDTVMQQYENKKDPAYFQMWTSRDTVLERSSLLKGGDLPRFETPLQRHSFHDVTLPDGKYGRLVEKVFVPRRDDIVTSEANSEYTQLDDTREVQINLVVAVERVTLQQQRTNIRMLIAGAMISILIGIALLVTRFINTGLLPLDRLVAQVKGIDAKSLDSRIAHTGVQSIELAPIEHQINSLLERLESAFQREKRFSADIAHELRTPLAELKTLSEIGRQQPADSAAVTDFFRDVEDISDQMEALVTTLLELSRADAGQLQNHPEEFLLSELINSVWLRITGDSQTDKRLINEVPDDIRVRADHHMMALVLRNLLSNAARYSPDDAEVHVYSVVKNSIELSITNPVIDLEDADIPRMHERFWQKEKARSDSGHSGLGLSLVMALAAAMQITVHIHIDGNNILRVVLNGLQHGFD
jgi:signal transduction histidine kinase